MLVLGIESSCDETGVALYDGKRGLIAQALHSQIALHQQYGGVVPELASRDHVNHLIPLTESVLRQGQIEAAAIDVVAYTAGPGLIGALLTGACFAKSLAFSLNRPALAIHHLEAHLLAAMLDSPDLQFPFLALLVSGGHTQLIEARALGDYCLLGDTLDDAVGEAFDKTAKLMGLPYPGGAQLAGLADKASAPEHTLFAPFPRPMTDRPGLDFSFSGLKTHALTCWQNSAKDDAARRGIAYAFQQAVVDTLVIKCRRAVEKTAARRLVVAGGVGANQALRSALGGLMQGVQGAVYFPRPDYCTDNGAMVAFAGYLHAKNNQYDSSQAIEVKARWPLTSESI
ncbi:tRNA (adenosine(37)-N6)-threonylcarbamoyltransferase complex transferase subunit TsaD [Legionella sp. MW5194]|uniref:tRNA (adenosine(37)-N6)-threonylcarbamoyltransferase complex transferase subunit TsaD n=1 Tax=Legionella sp. MW5194 TaxID=2662448 RepID=UPI00193E73D3|nr:tRNA (adenosine(37)-N6)-threonylcarbamoyltransferase complex transferase subunit TsaD [Legionella sp. MW5194]QRN04604.1 tRNA (adenosine(37)-N6)-threonylcarbamoyltransferase complex transferase subunit TsaD [Legionella sp. MW5194]